MKNTLFPMFIHEPFNLLLVIPDACRSPPDGTNTVPVPDDCSLSYGEKYTYSCLEGFETADQLTVECEYDSTGRAFILSPAAPNCTGM